MWTIVYICLQEATICVFAAAKRNWNITRILLFLDDLLMCNMFNQAFGVKLSFNRCGMLVHRFTHLLGTVPL